MSLERLSFSIFLMVSGFLMWMLVGMAQANIGGVVPPPELELAISILSGMVGLTVDEN